MRLTSDTPSKAYDTVDSRYIKLDEIVDMIDAGEEIRIIDNETKEDITIPWRRSLWTRSVKADMVTLALSI